MAGRRESGKGCRLTEKLSFLKQNRSDMLCYPVVSRLFQYNREGETRSRQKIDKEPSRRERDGDEWSGGRKRQREGAGGGDMVR